MLSSGRSKASRPVLGIETPLVDWDIRTPFVNERSGASRVEKDVEGLDSTAFDSSDIGPGHGHGTVRWSGSPAQPSDTVVTDGGANRSEDEVWRQARQQCFHRLIDGGMA